MHSHTKQRKQHSNMRLCGHVDRKPVLYLLVSTSLNFLLHFCCDGCGIGDKDVSSLFAV